MKTVGSRFKSDYRFSESIVYNTFPFCQSTKKMLHYQNYTTLEFKNFEERKSIMSKKILDIFLLILFFVCLSSTFVTEKMHEICGITFVFTVLAHNFFNRNFYKNFSHRNKTNKLCIILFAFVVMILTVSGIMLWQAENSFYWQLLEFSACHIWIGGITKSK